MRGAHAEQRAFEHLEAHGLTVLERNHRVRGGEIDLIAQDGEVIVFVEVKERASDRYGSALEAVTPRKAALVRRAALEYAVKRLGRDDVLCRFDVIAIDAGRLVWHQNAF